MPASLVSLVGNEYEQAGTANGSGEKRLVFYDTVGGRINVIETPSANPAGDAVLCIHGFPCDARIFAYAGSKLAQAGYNVFSMDLPGHGKSGGPKGDLDFDACLES